MLSAIPRITAVLHRSVSGQQDKRKNYESHWYLPDSKKSSRPAIGMPSMVLWSVYAMMMPS
jgi:hypothetical protein